MDGRLRTIINYDDISLKENCIARLISRSRHMLCIFHRQKSEWDIGD